MLRITKRLFIPLSNIENFNIEKKHLLNLIEQQFIGINILISKTNCSIDNFFLSQEIEQLNKIKNKINMNILTQDEIKIKRNELSEKYINYLNKK